MGWRQTSCLFSQSRSATKRSFYAVRTIHNIFNMLFEYKRVGLEARFAARRHIGAIGKTEISLASSSALIGHQWLSRGVAG